MASTEKSSQPEITPAYATEQDRNEAMAFATLMLLRSSQKVKEFVASSPIQSPIVDFIRVPPESQPIWSADLQNEVLDAIGTDVVESPDHMISIISRKLGTLGGRTLSGMFKVVFNTYYLAYSAYFISLDMRGTDFDQKNCSTKIKLQPPDISKVLEVPVCLLIRVASVSRQESPDKVYAMPSCVKITPNENGGEITAFSDADAECTHRLRGATQKGTAEGAKIGFSNHYLRSSLVGGTATSEERSSERYFSFPDAKSYYLYE